VVAGLLAGAGTAVFFFLYGELRPLDLHEGILGLMVHIPVLIGVSLATPAQDAEHVAHFVESGTDPRTGREAHHA